MSKKTKLELTWIGKDRRPRLEPRILLEDPELSYAAKHRVTENDIFDNMLIHGDNLLALKALEQDFAGRVKCIFIDPPYNTGSAFEHYDDGVEHSIWLSLMRERLELMRRLLSESGSLWVTIDDNEAHYLKVLCDEIYGRANFIANVIWEKSDSPRMDAQFFSSRHDHMFVYAKNKETLSINRIDDGGEYPAHYNKIDDNGRRYYLKPLRAMGHEDTRKDRPSMYYVMIAPDGKQVLPVKQDGSDGRWRWGQERAKRDAHLIEWVQGRNGWQAYYRIFLKERKGRPPETIWFHSEVGSNRTSKAEAKKLFPHLTAFGTPKPEALLQRVISLATSTGDVVFDSFAGSGTTGAVAHKMGRRWIMVELGDHAITHVPPRMRKVIDGADLGGVTNLANWKGGGGFRFYRLAPSLLEEDKWGNWVINRAYNKEMLAEAMCKLEGFRYAPSKTTFWMHGQSTETDYIYVTTQTLTHEQLQVISAEVGPERTLLLCCSAFRARLDQFPNLTVKKIPAAVLARCEWGKDDYSLNVETVMGEEPEPEPEPEEAESSGMSVAPKKKRRSGKVKMQELPLFALASQTRKNTGGDQ